MSAIYNFDPQVAGNTFEQRVMAIKRNVNGTLQPLTNATALFEVYREGSSRVWLSQNCNILDEEECVIGIPEIKSIALTPYEYLWRITITYEDGDIKTYVGGEFPVREIKNEQKWPIQ